eukprot:TCONS_00049574-protein
MVKKGKGKQSEEDIKIPPSDVFIFPNGDKYEGNFCQLSDETISRCGTGRHTTHDGIIMEGTWENNKLNGKGKIVHPSGACYEGDVLDNMMHGQGTYVFTDKSIYEGQFNENRLEGEGQLTDPSGQVWCGMFTKDSANGLEFKLNM